MEGGAEATQNIVQGLSGWLSDTLRRRKPIAVLGYLVAATAKPLIGLSTTWPGVLGARFTDRFGAGLRSAPRDALIAASVQETNRGKAFGPVRSAERPLALAFIIFLITYLGFGVTRNVISIGACFMLYGLYQGIGRSVGKALATDLVPPTLRASGLSWYSATTDSWGWSPASWRDNSGITSAMQPYSSTAQHSPPPGSSR